MALGYSASNAATFPSVWYTGRLATDPLGTMPQGEGVIHNGTGSQTGSPRWGDYTSMNVDPVDDCTFWYVNEYLPVTSSVGWRLRIGAFRFPDCDGGGGSTVHSGDLDAIKLNSGARWRTQVTVLVHDDAENPVSGAVVDFDINGAVTRSCTTGAAGTCFIRATVSDSLPSLTFTVTDITAAGFSYAPGDNHDPDADSDGTTIVVTQP
jgi:hypothetical protein